AGLLGLWPAEVAAREPSVGVREAPVPAIVPPVARIMALGNLPGSAANAAAQTQNRIHAAASIPACRFWCKLQLIVASSVGNVIALRLLPAIRGRQGSAAVWSAHRVGESRRAFPSTGASFPAPGH